LDKGCSSFVMNCFEERDSEVRTLYAQLGRQRRPGSRDVFGWVVTINIIMYFAFVSAYVIRICWFCN
jgi:hypothetical protein